MVSSNSGAAYQQNAELFRQFYAQQGEYAAALAQRPELIRAWLEARPNAARAADESERAPKSKASQRWRTARLSLRRRQDLSALLAAATGAAPDSAVTAAGPAAKLSTWIRACLPVLSLLEMADHAQPAASYTAILALRGQLMAMRENVFMANYGLAKISAARGHPDGFDDRMSAACIGLLNAVDRYVPGEKAARFSYFATYWIRYHITRQAQKFGGVIAFPIYQQRMGRRLAQLAIERHKQGLGEASEAEACAALDVGPDAYRRHLQKPTVVSLQAPVGDDDSALGLEHLLCDPAPPPGEEYEFEDASERINGWLRRSFPPATRVILAYAHQVGPLAEAGAEYLDHLREIAGERLRFVAG